MNSETILALASQPPPPAKLTSRQFTSARAANERIAELRRALGQPPGDFLASLRQASARVSELEQLAAIAANISTAPPAAKAAVQTSTPSLEVLRALELEVFGGNTVGFYSDSDATQVADLTRKFYERNLAVPGLDFSALAAAGAWHEINFGLARAVRASEQLRVDKFFATRSATLAQKVKLSGLTGRAKSKAALRIEGMTVTNL